MENQQQVRQIEDSEDLHTTLGITEERRNVLAELIFEAYESSKTQAESVIAVTKDLTHPNEIAYCCFKLGMWVEHVNQLEDNPLMAMIGMIRGIKDSEDN